MDDASLRASIAAAPVAFGDPLIRVGTLGVNRSGGAHDMADGSATSGAGIGIGGILVIIGIVVAIVWSLWLGILIAIIGLVAFGGFVRGRWY